MKVFLLLAAAAVCGPACFQIDLGHYFPDRDTEQTERASLLARVESFEQTRLPPLATGPQLSDWLDTYDALLAPLRKHEAYVYLLAERDSDDHSAEAADGILWSAIRRIDVTAQRNLAAIGSGRLNLLMAGNPSVARYRSFIELTLSRGTHAGQNSEAVAALADPALRSLATSYKTLLPAPMPAGEEPKAMFDAKWLPFARNEAAFAALLIPIVHIQDGKARLRGFAGAPEAAYDAAGLTAREVNETLSAIRLSGAAKRYDAMVAAAVARRRGIPVEAVHAWDLETADNYRPPVVSFPEAVPLVLAAEKPMGDAYFQQYARLFDPSARRVEWCQEARCDRTGFSFGFAGVQSGLFYGHYRGDTNSIRAIAHEAGHAVHRQFMSEHQKLAVYNAGPSFMFESFAIFNELLLLDHLYRAAAAPEAKAYYLHQFLDDVTFQIYGSAQETDLEQSIYSALREGSVHSAADLDALTLEIFARYRSAPALEPDMRVYWARNRLYSTDPLYDVNYLFAGLLAIEYFRQYEADPKGFSARYVALLKSGFTDRPQVLEKRFLGIDLDDASHLVATATTVVDARTAALRALYAQ